MSGTYDIHGQTAVITLNNPPVNGLSHDLRTRIVTGVQAALAAPDIQSIVLIGSSRAFSGGADIREFNLPIGLAEPNLPQVIDVIESSTKPIIAAIGGVCMGGGLELALGCHYRIALADALIALPEVKLGVLPGAGGTQRLPRLLNAEIALGMIVTGEASPAAKFKGTALFDQIVDGDLLAAALHFAAALADAPKPLVRTRDLPVLKVEPSAFAQVSTKLLANIQPGYPAPAKCVEAVRAALELPFADGLRREQELFHELVETSASKALRHAFFAERAATKLASVAESTQARPIKQVGIIGAGTMGSGIAMNFLNAGIATFLLEIKADALERGVATIRKTYDSAVKKGKLKPVELEQRLSLLRATTDYADLAAADLIIEAVFEDMSIKEQVFGKLDQVAKPGAILASNTSTLDLNVLAAVTKRPEDVIGLHFFSPAHLMKLLEVVRGAKTADDVLVTAMALAKKIKKTAVVSGVCDGFIGNRMIAPYSQQAIQLLEEGCTPSQVDQALESWGMAMGPFRMGDLAGNDIGWAIRKHQRLTVPDPEYPRIPDRLCEIGRYGQKTGAGWYRYEAGSREALVDPVVLDLITAYRAEKGIKTRTISDAEIVERCIYALYQEGTRILDEGIAQRASDIDLVYLCGYGFPLHRGGPMFYAETVGLAAVAQRVASFYAQSGDPLWRPVTEAPARKSSRSVESVTAEARRSAEL